LLLAIPTAVPSINPSKNPTTIPTSVPNTRSPTVTPSTFPTTTNPSSRTPTTGTPSSGASCACSGPAPCQYHADQSCLIYAYDQATATQFNGGNRCASGSTDCLAGTAASASPTASADPLCLTGIPKWSVSVCCALSCGQCGGVGCSNFTGGSTNCCAGNIQTNGVFCNDRGPPCRLTTTIPSGD
jgi:hypothetical protein